MRIEWIDSENVLNWHHYTIKQGWAKFKQLMANNGIKSISAMIEDRIPVLYWHRND